MTEQDSKPGLLGFKLSYSTAAGIHAHLKLKKQFILSVLCVCKILKVHPFYKYIYIYILTLKAFCIEVQSIHSIVIVSGEQWRDSARHTRVSVLPQMLLPSRLAHILKFYFVFD